MSARALVTRYSDELANIYGDFILQVHYFVCDPARQGDGSGHDGRAEAVQLTLPANDPTAWAGLIEQAVLDDCVARGFTDITANNVKIPRVS